METDHKPAPAPSRREGFTQKIGNTTYDVSFHYSTRSRESANDKIMRLIENEILHGRRFQKYD